MDFLIEQVLIEPILAHSGKDTLLRRANRLAHMVI